MAMRPEILAGGGNQVAVDCSDQIPMLAMGPSVYEGLKALKSSGVIEKAYRCPGAVRYPRKDGEMDWLPVYFRLKILECSPWRC